MSNRRFGVVSKYYAQALSTLFVHRKLSGRGAYIYRGARHMSIGVALNDPADLRVAIGLSEQFAMMIHAEAVIATRQRGYVNYQVELPPTMWRQYTRQDVSSDAIGLAERRQPVKFSIDPPHSLFAGTSGSGKTEAIKSAIVSLTQTHTPDQVGLIVIDSNGQFTDFRNEAHLVTQVAERDIDNALRVAWSLFSHRRQRRITDDKPVVIAIDEVADIIRHKESLVMLQDIARQGRKYAVHLMVGMQKPTHKALPDILDNILNRFVGQVTDATVSNTLTGHAGLMAHKLTGSGDFLHVTGGTVTRFQVARVMPPDIKNLPRRDVKTLRVPTTPPHRPAPVVRPVGRPRNQPQPQLVARYMVSPPSFRQAAAMGISRPNHVLHRDFAKKVQDEINRIIEDRDND